MIKVPITAAIHPASQRSSFPMRLMILQQRTVE
jgi:hypothetical protein